MKLLPAPHHGVMAGIAAFLITFASCGASAADNERAGPDWTPAGVEKQRAAQELNCRRNITTETYNDCACVARTMAELATAPGETRSFMLFTEQAYDACPQQDRAVLAKSIFESCESYMSTVRTDHASFCKCAADGFVQRFYAGKPQVNQRWREKLRRDAMESCGLGDQSKAIVTSTPVSAADAANGCVKFYANEKRISSNAAENKRLGHESRTSPDVVLVNDCGNIIRLMTTVEYAAPVENARPECAIKRLFPGENFQVRSQSKVVRSGLETRIPRTNLFLCLGDVVESGVNRFKNDCSCGAFPRVEVPLGETLKPLP